VTSDGVIIRYQVSGTGYRAPVSVLGARCPALGANPVPGIRYQVPGTRDLEPGIRHLSSKNPHTGYAKWK